VVFARTLAERPAVLIADEPTQAVDAGARIELYRFLRRAADQGSAVIVLSSNARELEGLCDRVLVFSRGRVAAELAGDQVTEDAITRSALTSAMTRESERETRRSADRSWWRGDYLPSLLLLTLSALVAGYTVSQNANYLSSFNVTTMLLALSGLGFIALGQFVVILLGGVDLSVGPVVSLLAVIGSFLVAGPGVGQVVLGLAALTVVACLVGLLNGAMVRGVGMSPVIATLVTYFAAQGVALMLRPSPGGSIDPGLVAALQSVVGPIPVSFIVLVALTLILEWSLRRTRWGVEHRATGSSEPSAHRLGVAVDRRHVQAYVLCALLTFAGALMLMAQVQVGDAAAGTEYTLASISAVVIGGVSIFGGRGTAIGVLCGAVLLQQMLTVGTFLNLASHWQYVFVGVFTLGAAGAYSRAGRAR